MAHRVGRGIALLFHDRGTRRGWVVSSTPRLHFTPGKDPVPTLQEAGWAPGPVWTGRKSHPHRDSILDSPARSQLLYRLSYPAHTIVKSTITYAAETWCLKAKTVAKLNSTEIDFWRRSARISRKDKIRNNVIRQENEYNKISFRRYYNQTA